MSPRAAFAIFGLVAAPVAAGEATLSPPAIRLVWLDPIGVAEGGEFVARSEVETLLARMGVRASWRRGAPGELMRTDEVAVILIGERPQPSSDLVLGATLRRQTCPAVWIRVPNIRRAVGVRAGTSLFGLNAFEQRLVSIALGRVIAHEVVHVFAPWIPHGTGLTSASLTREQLRAPSIAVEPEVALAVQAALRGTPVYEPGPSGVLAAQIAAPDAAPDKDR
jgi:hypothetical protein